MLRKPNMLLPSHSSFNCLYCHQSAPVYTSSSSPKSQSSRYLHPRKPPFRCFTDTRSNTSRPTPPRDLPWPDLTSANVVPTPYQIFGLKKHSPYSKRRFYELVKIYHPDKNGLGNGFSNIESVSQSTKTERYRLIVTAHEILSDPVKRSAYDTYGAGWDGWPDHSALKCTWRRNHDAKWSGFDNNDSPFGNATWEDWEKWYQRDKAKQEPVYFSNGGFLMLVLTAVFLAAFGQSTRVGNNSNVSQKQVENVHNDASIAIRQCRTESQAFENRDERLQNFLRARTPHGCGVTDTTERSYRKLSREPEVCMSEVTNKIVHDHTQKTNS